MTINDLTAIARSKGLSPADADDVVQDTLLSLFRQGHVDESGNVTCDRKLAVMRLYSRIVDQHRARKVRLASDVTETDVAAPMQSETPDVSHLLRHAGQYRDDVAAWMTGNSDRSQAMRVSRGLARIREFATK